MLLKIKKLPKIGESVSSTNVLMSKNTTQNDY